MDIKVKADTIARTAVLALALINQCLCMFGKGTIAIAEDDLYQLISVGATVAAAVWAWWKNNSFTRAAIKADELMHAEKGKGE